MRKSALIAILALSAAATSVQAKSMKWADVSGAGLPAGAQMAVVSGNPGKAGPFVVQIKMPANYAVPAHHHPTDEVVRVLDAGTLNYGMSDKLDKSNAGQLTKGYHVNMAAGMNHWVFTGDSGALIQVSGTGPFQIVYVDPKDDPRTAK
jgi:hypothetical protein